MYLYQSAPGCHNQIPQLGGLNNRCLLHMAVEAVKSNIKVLIDSVQSRSPLPRLQTTKLVTLTSHARERENPNFSLFLLRTLISS